MSTVRPKNYNVAVSCFTLCRNDILLKYHPDNMWLRVVIDNWFKANYILLVANAWNTEVSFPSFWIGCFVLLLSLKISVPTNAPLACQVKNISEKKCTVSYNTTGWMLYNFVWNSRFFNRFYCSNNMLKRILFTLTIKKASELKL